MSAVNAGSPSAKFLASFNIGEFTLEKKPISVVSVRNPSAPNLSLLNTKEFTLSCAWNTHIPCAVSVLHRVEPQGLKPRGGESSLYFQVRRSLKQLCNFPTCAKAFLFVTVLRQEI